MGEAVSKCCSNPKKEGGDIEVRFQGPEGYGKNESDYSGSAPVATITNATMADANPKFVKAEGKNGDSEHIVQDDPDLLVPVDGLKLVSSSAKFMEPSKLKECQSHQQKFMFGRSESKLEEQLRRRASGEQLTIGTHIVQCDAAATDQEQKPSSRIRFAANVAHHVVAAEPESADQNRSSSGEALSYETIRSLTVMFNRFAEGSNEITMAEAIEFWGQSFSKISAAAMFAEADADGNGNINLDEFITFWQNVKRKGYTEKEIVDELKQLMDGGRWADWRNGRRKG